METSRWHWSVDVIVRPVAVDEEIPEHHHDHRDCQGEIIRQKFRVKKPYWEEGQTGKKPEKKWF